MPAAVSIGTPKSAVEAACNPLVADLYKEEKTKWLNRFHVWFPGGIVIGAVVSYVMTNAGIGWQPQIAVMLIPTAIYGVMVFTTAFPALPDRTLVIPSIAGHIPRTLFRKYSLHHFLCLSRHHSQITANGKKLHALLCTIER